MHFFCGKKTPAEVISHDHPVHLHASIALSLDVIRCPQFLIAIAIELWLRPYASLTERSIGFDVAGLDSPVEMSNAQQATAA